MPRRNRRFVIASVLAMTALIVGDEATVATRRAS